MAVQGVSIALATEDVARSVQFYLDQLGFACPLKLDGFARVRLGAADMEYGVREFGLLDDNGYRLSFAQHVAAN
jgi:hypothetical protein